MLAATYIAANQSLINRGWVDPDITSRRRIECWGSRPGLKFEFLCFSLWDSTPQCFHICRFSSLSLRVSSGSQCAFINSSAPSCLARAHPVVLWLDSLYLAQETNRYMFITHGDGASVTANNLAGTAKDVHRWGGDHSCTTSGRTRSSLRGIDGANRRNARSLGWSRIASTGSRGTDPSRRKHERVREARAQQGDVARQLQWRGSHEIGSSRCRTSWALDLLEWIAQEQEDAAEDKFDRIAVQRGWTGQARDHTRFSRYQFAVLSNRTDGTPHRLVRNGRHSDGVNAWRRQHMEHAPVTSATAQGFMKKSLEILRAKTTQTWATRSRCWKT